MADQQHLTVTISRVDEILFEGDVHSLHVTGTAGELTILANHAPLVTTLQAGEAIVRPVEGEEQRITIAGGILEVADNTATVLA
jgi:F-type H+-transporting ATPase subunit epsilon